MKTMTTEELTGKLDAAVEELKACLHVDHFLLVWHNVDHMPMAGIAPSNIAPVRTTMPLKAVPDMLRRMATAVEEQMAEIVATAEEEKPE